MAKSRNELAQERGQLIERIAHQREALARDMAPLLEVEQASERLRTLAHTALQRVRDNPLPLTLVLVALIAWQPRRAWRWARRGLWLWRQWLALRGSSGP